MICQNCRDGGFYNQKANEHRAKEENNMADLARESSKEYHEKCESPQSCLCQHRIGMMVQ